MEEFADWRRDTLVYVSIRRAVFRHHRRSERVYTLGMVARQAGRRRCGYSNRIGIYLWLRP